MLIIIKLNFKFKSETTKMEDEVIDEKSIEGKEFKIINADDFSKSSNLISSIDYITESP